MSSVAERTPLAERLCRHPRAVVAGTIAALAALAWSWTIAGAGLGNDRSMAEPAQVSVLGAVLVLLMWWVMMAAMMLPSAAPAILLYGRIRQQRGEATVIAPSWMFLGGYLLAWLAFAVLLATVQIVATRTALLNPMTMRATSPLLAGAALVAIGIYQLSPLKDACLVNCRSPANFLSRHWRPGSAGACRLGLMHGLYCVGCCWLLMGLLFVGGVMNFFWIAGLAACVALEKLSIRGSLISKLIGGVLILWGLAPVVT